MLDAIFKRKSYKLIEKYIDGIINEYLPLSFDYGKMSYRIDLTDNLNQAVKYFLKNSDFQSANEIRNRKEFKIFANAHYLMSEQEQMMFAEVLDLLLTNRTIIVQYKLKPKNLDNLDNLNRIEYGD